MVIGACVALAVTAGPAPWSSGPTAAEPLVPVLVEQAGAAPRLAAALVDPEAPPAAGAPLATTVVGRIAPAAVAGGVARHQWPGLQVAARFAGDAVVVAFDDPLNRYRVALGEGAGPVVAVTRPGRRALRLSGLGPGPHIIRVEKISESLAEPTGLPSLRLPAGGTALPPPDPAARRIAFMGDSDTVGYGNLSDGRDCSAEEVFLATDTQRSFGPSVARHFGAEFQMIAASGLGLLRNYGGAAPGRTLSAIHDRLLPNEPGRIAPDGWSPHVVVVAIGSNDFVAELAPEEPWADWSAFGAAFEAAYVDLIRDVRATSPDAFVLMLAWREYGPDYLSVHEGAFTALAAAGVGEVALLVLPEMDKTGCHWHPSLADHAGVAAAIIADLEARPDLWDE